MRGSLLGYSTLFARRICTPYTRKKPESKSGKVLLVVFVFMVLSVIGRFSVAFLGFAYNLQETPHNQQPLFRPDWVNLTFPLPFEYGVEGDNSITSTSSIQTASPKLSEGEYLVCSTSWT